MLNSTKNPNSKTLFNEHADLITTNLAEGIPVRQLNLVMDQISLYRRLFIVTILANSTLVIMGFIYL